MATDLRILRIEIHAPHNFFCHQHLEPSAAVLPKCSINSLKKMIEQVTR
jgi:hypothetical protein